MVASDADAPRATVPTNTQQAGKRPAALAPQRRFSPTHSAALERRFHPWSLGGLHGEKHCP